MEVYICDFDSLSKRCCHSNCIFYFSYKCDEDLEILGSTIDSVSSTLTGLESQLQGVTKELQNYYIKQISC